MVADGKILIAIDLGTTFSGIAWAHTARVCHFTTLHFSNFAHILQPATRSIIGQWPDIHDSLDGITSGKVPTEIYYDEASIKWGFQIPEFEKRYQCFKLELESSVAKDSSHLGLLYPDPKSLRVNQRTTGEVLISEYLTCLRKHISEILKISLCDNVLETTTLEYIISVPAIWSEAARAKTRSCAERAGMSAGLQLVLEPEAAIMHAVDQELSQMDVGDIVVVCDAGGGTVDLISYIIDQREPTLDISEAAPGTGNACGSNFLNRMFRQKLQERFGRFPGWGDDTLQEALEYFERVVKRKFNGNQDQWLVPVPGLPDDKDAGIRRGKLIMSGNEIRTLFEPVIAIITSLLQMQIAISKKKGTIKIVYLVGGFGESAYLRESLKKVVPEAIQVISPANAWTAVVRGALIKGLAAASPSAAKVKVGSRVARKAYGIKVREKFNANMHQDHQKYAARFLTLPEANALQVLRFIRRPLFGRHHGLVRGEGIYFAKYVSVPEADGV